FFAVCFSSRRRHTRCSRDWSSDVCSSDLKTTLLRLIAGFEAPDHGRVEVGGRIVAGDGVWVQPERRRIGFVFQDFALFPHMSVLDRKSTRLNSSHVKISYAVFCLKKKKAS